MSHSKQSRLSEMIFEASRFVRHETQPSQLVTWPMLTKLCRPTTSNAIKLKQSDKKTTQTETKA